MFLKKGKAIVDKQMDAEQLSNAWLDAKAAEDAAKARRIEIEEALVARLGKREEGAQTHDLDGFKVTITGVINRSLDKKAWERIKERIPEDRRPVTYVPKLDVAGVKWLHANDPATYRIVAQALVVKPGKTNVKVTVIGKEKR